ncbi:alpha-L-fucosidase [Marinilabiliaceae bacterium ANBcel2]|nr:alpha-L-fucosidase [Marinilabiliaceae bacterium ANBcel2]
MIIKYIYLFICLLLFTACGSGSESYYVQTAAVPEGATIEEKIEFSGRVVPHPRQMKWFEDEFLGFIHYGPNTYTGREWGTGHEDAAIFEPTDLDTDQWCELMYEAGIRRVVMVVKHHEGYCLWQTRYTDYSVSASPWKDGQGDVLRELAESCEKYGLRLGIYLSPADLYQIEADDGLYGNDSEYTQRTIPRQVDGRPFKDERTFTYEVDDYNEYFLNQLFELLTEYGPIYEVWFDGAHPKPGTGQEYNYDAWFDLIRTLAPDAVIFGKGPDVRWCGNEGGATREAEYNVIPLEDNPEGYDWPDMMGENIAGREHITEDTRYFHYYPAETNTSIRHGWFWRNDDEQQVRSADDVFDIYERSVGGNSVLHLNIPPNTEGKFSDRDANVLRETGRRIREVYGSSLLDDGSTQFSEILDGNSETWWQAPSTQSQIEVTLSEPKAVNRFMIQEAIAHRGERIEEHHLEAYINGEWEVVAEGKTVGYKRILRFPEVKTERLRLIINKSRIAPAISHISAHYYDEPPKPVVIGFGDDGEITLGVGTNFSWRNHGAVDLSQTVYYTLDGSEPDANSSLYKEPLLLPDGGYLKARSISGDRKGPVSEYRIGVIKDNWSAVDGAGESVEASKAVNGDYQVGWTSNKGASSNSITIDMKENLSVSGLAYTPNAPEAYIESYTVEVSRDGEKWMQVYSGDFGNIRNDPSRRDLLFDSAYKARYIRLTDLVPPGGASVVGILELDVFVD